MQYTTVSEVRADVGFVGNTNISDSFIQNLITIAQSTINSRISDVYQVPIPKFYKNLISFTGNGSGAGTMTFTIDGVAYAVSITSGMTAAQAADALRTLLLADTDKDFYLADDLGQGADVGIISGQNGLAADVTVTVDSETVAGITTAIDGVVASTIPMINGICRYLVGGRLLNIDYGPESQNTTKEGDSLIEAATTLLDDIANKNLKLLDPAGTELATADTQSLAFYPTEASRDDAENPTANKFNVNDIF